MANLNLSPTSLERQRKEGNTLSEHSGIIPVGIIVASFSILFGMQFYNNLLEKKMASIDDQTVTQKSLLNGDALDRVVSFEQRLVQIDQKLSTKEKSPQDILSSIEKLMVSGVSLDSYAYDASTQSISLKVIGNDFKSIAQQAVSFKSNDTFSAVLVSDTSKSDSGLVTSQMIISL